MVSQLHSDGSPGGLLKTTVTTSVLPSRLQPFVVNQAGATQVKMVSQTSLPKKALVGGLFVLIAWWSVSLLLPSRLAPRRRRRPVTV
jgi:hypothetical protein